MKNNQKLINTLIELKTEMAVIPLLRTARLRAIQTTKASELLDKIIDDLRKSK